MRGSEDSLRLWRLRTFSELRSRTLPLELPRAFGGALSLVASDPKLRVPPLVKAPLHIDDLESPVTFWLDGDSTHFARFGAATSQVRQEEHFLFREPSNGFHIVPDAGLEVFGEQLKLPPRHLEPAPSARRLCGLYDSEAV